MCQDVYSNTHVVPLKTLGSSDNDERITGEYGGSTTLENILTAQYRALPGKLVLCGVLASNYPRLGDSTTSRIENEMTIINKSHE